MSEHKFDSTTNRIHNMDRAELEDLLASIRFEILRVVKILGREYKNLMTWQEKRDRIETRLEELGMRIKDQQ